MDAGKGHETPGSEMKNNLLCTAIALARLLFLSVSFAIPQSPNPTR